MSINVNDKNLGHATAYAYYKAGGGTMTEAEFTEFMADFGTASQTAVEAAQAALASETAARNASTTATNKASEATTAATTATTKAGEASTSASTATSAKDTAVSASQTATTKATEATTAAATATSAATTATTAKDYAVSAKTAAQTAQTGAETAAASVEASAEQIATNAADISQLKSELTANTDAICDAIGLYIPPKSTGVTPQNAQANVVLDGLNLISGHSYTYKATYASASSAISYIYLTDADINVISSINIQAGTASAEQTFVAAADYENAKILINPTRQALNYEVTITDNSIDKTTKIEALETTVGNAAKIIFEENRYIATPSIGSAVNLTSNALNGCACFSIPCSKGDIFTITGTPRDNSGTRPYMWVDSDGKCNYRSEETTVFNAEEIVAPINGTLVVNMLSANAHSAYDGVVDVVGHVVKNINNIKAVLNSPLETLPEYFKNTMAYKPLGQLQKPYLCLTCDDGAAELETYTIPMLLTKNVPCTFGLMAAESPAGEYPVYHNSEVLRTQSGINAVLNAVENGCEVAQHGALEWTDLTEVQLNTFFDREKIGFAELGITPKGAICPSHCVNNQVRVIAGGRFGSVRSGYNGFKSNADRIANISGDVFTPYEYNLTGARSNCYSYTSFNIIGVTLERAKQILDYAIANNMVMIIYWHDNDLNTEQKSVLESFIDYAKTTTVNFCTLSQIPTLV